MKAETFTGAILRKMSGMGKVQLKFFISLTKLFLTIRGRYNFLNFARYGELCEQNYRLNFEKKAITFHVNMALTVLNIAKAVHWISIPKEDRPAFSIADIKTQYVNELILDRLICLYGKDPNVEKNNPKIKLLYNLGKIAA